MTPVKPVRTGYALDLSGATLGTYSENALLTGEVKHTQALAATTIFGTDGYTLIAPSVRGPVDIPSNVHSQSGRVEFRQDIGSNAGAFLRGNFLNESRSNGTALRPECYTYLEIRRWHRLGVAELEAECLGVSTGRNRSTGRTSPR